MKLLITILILFFPIIGEVLAKLITQEWDDITDFLLTIPPFNIISAMRHYYGKENIEVNYNVLLLQISGLFIVTILGTIGIIYMYLYSSNLFNTEYNINETSSIQMTGGNTQINNSFFKKFYI